MSTETTVQSAEGATLLDRMMSEGKMARDESQRGYARDLIAEFVDQVLAETGEASSADVVELINSRVAQIDELISVQLNEVLHAPEFQKLESTWRGLNYLVMNTETSTRLKLRVMNVAKSELLKDLEKAGEFDQSALF